MCYMCIRVSISDGAQMSWMRDGMVGGMRIDNTMVGTQLE